MTPASFDAVIVGAGAAGLLAALKADDLGARVALLDASEADRSNLWVSSGLFSAAGTRLQREAGVDDDEAMGPSSSAPACWRNPAGSRSSCSTTKSTRPRWH